MLKNLLEQRTIGNRDFLPLSGQALLGFRLLPGAVRESHLMPVVSVSTSLSPSSLPAASRTISYRPTFSRIQTPPQEKEAQTKTNRKDGRRQWGPRPAGPQGQDAFRCIHLLQTGTSALALSLPSAPPVCFPWRLNWSRHKCHSAIQQGSWWACIISRDRGK